MSVCRTVFFLLLLWGFGEYLAQFYSNLLEFCFVWKLCCIPRALQKKNLVLVNPPFLRTPSKWQKTLKCVFWTLFWPPAGMHNCSQFEFFQLFFVLSCQISAGGVPSGHFGQIGPNGNFWVYGQNGSKTRKIRLF